jgi:hypothetical protein
MAHSSPGHELGGSEFLSLILGAPTPWSFAIVDHHIGLRSQRSLVRRSLTIVIAFVAATLAGCGGGERPSAATPDIQSIVAAIVKERAYAYPDAQVVDLVVSPNGQFVCGVIREGARTPYVFKGFRHQGEWKVVGPHLVREGSWDDPANSERSRQYEEDCKKVGALVDVR